MTKPQKAFTYTQDIAIDKDVKTLFDWVSRLEIVTDNPDGVRKGRFTGEAVYLQLGGNHYVEICTQAGTTVWLGVQLTNTP